MTDIQSSFPIIEQAPDATVGFYYRLCLYRHSFVPTMQDSLVGIGPYTRLRLATPELTVSYQFKMLNTCLFAVCRLPCLEVTQAQQITVFIKP